MEQHDRSQRAGGQMALHEWALDSRKRRSFNRFASFVEGTNLLRTSSANEISNLATTTFDDTPPLIDTFDPADEAIDVVVSSDLTLNFDSDVQKGGAGNFRISKLINFQRKLLDHLADVTWNFWECHQNYSVMINLIL